MIKKAELHVHLEGTIPPSLAHRLATRNRCTLPPGLIAADGESYQYSDFLDFLKTYDKVAALIHQPIDYYDITFNYLKENAQKGAIYIEMMYSPDHAEQASGIPSREHLEAIQKAIDDANHQHDIVGRIIITAVRHFGEQAAIKVAKQAIKDKLPCVVGFGLGGDEFNYRPRLFKTAYEIASKNGFQCTVHAGEFADASYMIEAMDYLPIDRIGHGVRGVDSPEVLSRLIDKNIALEICPSSNIRLGLYENLPAHPLHAFLEKGIKLSLNSDDPPFFSTTLAKEYDRVQGFLGYTDIQMNHFTQMAIDAAFISPAEKKALHSKI